MGSAFSLFRCIHAGIPEYKIGFGGGKDGRVGKDWYLDWPLCWPPSLFRNWGVGGGEGRKEGREEGKRGRGGLGLAPHNPLNRCYLL